MDETKQGPNAPAIIKTRGELADFNIAKYLWAVRQKVETGRDIKTILGPDSLEWRWYSKAAQSELNGQDGGFLAPEEWNTRFYDIIRDEGEFRRLPIQRYSTSARLQHLAVGTGEWVFKYGGDNTAFTASNVNVGQRNFQMRKAMAFRQFSNELFADASDFANRYIRDSAAEAVLFEQDKQTLVGNGQAGAPIGVVNATNVVVTSLGATPTTANIATGVANAMNLNGSANVPVGSTPNISVVTAPRIVLTIGSITAAGALPWQFGMGKQASVNYMGVPWVLTNSVPITLGGGGNQSLIFYGDWNQCMVVTRLDFEFLVSPSPDFSNYQTDVRIVMRFDVALLHPEAFFVHSGVNQ